MWVAMKLAVSPAKKLSLWEDHYGIEVGQNKGRMIRENKGRMIREVQNEKRSPA